MARGSSTATNAATTAANNSNTLFGNSESLYGALTPALEANLTAPPGMSPTDLAATNTAAQQSAGGSAAAAVGQGGLLAARTRNKGAPAAAIGQGIQSASENLSRSALGTQLANAKLKQQQQSQAEGELGNLTGEEMTGANAALGQVAPDVNANTGAENASYDWATDILDPALQAAGQGAAAFKPPGCWIAEAIWGVDDVRTHIVRSWLLNDFGLRWYGRPIMALYRKYGQRIAKMPRIVRILKPLFEVALGKATQWVLA